MKNSEYWKLRFEQLEAAQNGQGAVTVAEIEKQYKEAQKQLEGQISRWYQRFADNNGISLAEARQYLKSADLKEFKWDVQDYIKYGQDNAVSGQWMRQLENASAKFHISKLETLKIQTQHSLEVMFQKQLGTVTEAMGDVFESGYYHTAYELQKGFRIGWDIAGLDQSQLEKVIAKPWAVDGKNFSERIWGNKEKLISEVHNELTQNIMLGGDPQKAIDAIAKKMKTSRYNAGRLVMTEEAYFSSAAQQSCFDELGVEQYEIVATLDSHTSDICRSLDGKVFPMKDYQPGVTAPPFHIYCRSTTVPYFDENFGDIGERAARDEETGGTYYIPDDMKYQEWKETFVDGGDKSGFDVVMQQGGATVYVHHEEPEQIEKKPKQKTQPERKSAPQPSPVNASSVGDTVEVDVKTPKDNGGTGKTYQPEKIKHLKGSYSVKFEKVSGSPEITPQLAKEFSDEYDRFQEKFRKLSSVRSVEVKPYENDGIFGDYNDNSGVISIYGAGGKDGKTIISKVASDMKKSGKWSTSSPYHAFRHELGHALQKQLKESVHDYEKRLDKIEEIRKSIFDGLTGLSESDIIEMKKKKLSLYGLESDKELDEFISECVAEYCSKKPRKVARDVVNVLLNGVGD